MSSPFNIDSTSYPAANDDYEHEETTKTRICLHHTAGNSAEGAITTLRDPDYIMVHFLVDKNGDIYQFFPLKYWAFHLGVRDMPRGFFDKTSIGIEIVNVGALVPKNGNMCWWPRDFGAKFVSQSDTAYYYHLNSPWRGYEYYATYTSPQYETVARLVAWLCLKLNIPTQVFNTNFTCDVQDLVNFSGIFSHHNCRQDKFDLSPAWNWSYFSNLLGIAYQSYQQNVSQLQDPLVY